MAEKTEKEKKTTTKTATTRAKAPAKAASTRVAAAAKAPAKAPAKAAVTARPVGKRTTLVSAGVFKGHDTLGTAPDSDTGTLNVGEHQLTFDKILSLADRMIPVCERNFFKARCICVQMIDSDLIAIDQRRAQPSGNS